MGISAIFFQPSATTARQTTRHGQRLALRAMLGMALVFGVGSHAMAADDDDEPTFEEKILHGLIDPFLKGSPDIDYRERSPLVVPPTRDLPRPEANAGVINNPAWPVDADTKRNKEIAKARREARKRGPDGDAKVLRPEEMTPGKSITRQTAIAPNTGSPKLSEEESAKPLSPQALGYKGGLFSNMFGTNKREESASFAGEPTRGNLTDPPAGYRTPSAAQPYGSREDVFKPKAYDIADKPVGRN